MLFLWGLVALCCALMLYYMPKRGRDEPPLIGRFPFFGCILDFAKHPVGILKKCYEKYGDVFTVHIFGKKMTFLIGPEAHTAFFRASDKEVSAKEAYQFMVPLFGKGVVYDSPTEIMYQQLKFIKSGLTNASLRNDVDLMIPIIEKFVGLEWGQQGEMELLNTMNRLTILTATRCLIGPEVHNAMWNEASAFARYYHDLEKGINPLSFFFPNFPLPLPAFKRRDEARVKIVDVFSRIIEGRQTTGTRHEDTLQNLIEAQYKDGSSLNADQISGLLIALLFAGQHTSSITSAWTFIFLMQNQGYLKEVMEEQERVLAAHDGKLTFDGLREMVLLENAVKESLRMYPPLIQLMRMVKRPIQYKNYTIPEGHMVCVSPALAMRLDSSFDRPDEWDPHRFEKELPKFAFIPFGGGRHGCPGQVFGVQQVKTIWSVLLRSFEFELLPPESGGVHQPDYNQMVVGPAPPVRVRYKRKS